VDNASLEIHDYIDNLNGPEHTYDKSKVKQMLDIQAGIKKRKSTELEFDQPLITLEELPIIFQNSITIIQGKSGSHKSRVSEMLSACILKKPKVSIFNHLGFMRQTEDCCLVYIDTERNIKTQIPKAIQRINQLAGYGNSDNIQNFEYTSLMPFSRNERLIYLESYLKYLRIEKGEIPMIVVLDVITDCIGNFNDPKESMELIDLLNIYINEHNLSFICVIHENPGSNSKARGHIGTEINNKATTVIQTSIEEPDNPDSPITIKFIKCRNTKKPSPLLVVYNDSTSQLELAGDDIKRNFKYAKAESAPHMEILEYCKSLKFPIPRVKFITLLMQRFNCKERTVESRLKELVEDKTSTLVSNRSKCLYKEKKGKETVYNFQNLVSDAPLQLQAPI